MLHNIKLAHIGPDKYVSNRPIHTFGWFEAKFACRLVCGFQDEVHVLHHVRVVREHTI
jgi:hypothetical protein